MRRYITKEYALSNAIEKVLTTQNESIIEALAAVTITSKFKDGNIECHDDELEKCVSGSFSVEVRQVTSRDPEKSEPTSILGQFSDVSYEYIEGQHHFKVGTATIQ